MGDIHGAVGPILRRASGVGTKTDQTLDRLEEAVPRTISGVVQANAIKVTGLPAVFTDAQNVLPVGVALIVGTVLNGLLSADAKAHVVFLRWHHALPGHRAFSEHALGDPRIDVAALEKIHGGPLPTESVEQNRTWYRMLQVHRKRSGRPPSASRLPVHA